MFTVASVALLSWMLSHLQQAQGQREVASVGSSSTSWVRTVDGWEPSIVLQSDPNAASPPTLHPLLVASFQVTASLFALLAFPGVKAAAGDRKARSR